MASRRQQRRRQDGHGREPRFDRRNPLHKGDVRIDEVTGRPALAPVRPAPLQHSSLGEQLQRLLGTVTTRLAHEGDDALPDRALDGG
ncbi:hypothetical protein JNJ66_06870 [Candidatus Saccharibacteria bacterium]|nr:hypothetical protein [Candidatus Saccharibacteria bacterium]